MTIPNPTPKPRPPGRDQLLPAASETPPADVAFTGQSVRELRLARDLTLQALATASGLSTGFLSQIERGLSSPSVNALQAIAQALGVTIGWFFRPAITEGSQAARYIVRVGQRRRLVYQSGIIDELLSPDLAGPLELLTSRLPPGATSGENPYSHRGEEAGVVIEGALDLWIEEERFTLGTGDSFSFPSSKPHRYANPFDRDAVVIWVITPPTY